MDTVMVYQRLSTQGMAGKLLRFSAKLRWAPGADGTVSLVVWTGVGPRPLSAPSDRIAVQQLAQRTAEWRDVSVSIPIRASDASVVVGLWRTGPGDVHADALEVAIGGQSLDQLIASRAPSPADVLRLRQHLTPFPLQGEPLTEGAARQLDRIITGAGVVALGDGIHGTTEFQQVHAQVLSYLLEHRSFTKVGLEANFGVVQRLNAYVRDGVGNPQALVRSLGMWSWQTEEFVRVLQRLRDLQRTKRIDIVLFGMDSQDPTLAVDSAMAAASTLAEPARTQATAVYAQIRTILRGVGAYGSPRAADMQQWAKLAEQGARLLNEKPRDGGRVPWGAHYADLVLQAARQRLNPLSSNRLRDSIMAVNVRWAQRHLGRPGRTILWAHHSHVERVGNSTTAYLSRLGAETVVVIGTATFSGTYLADALNEHRAFSLSAALPGSIEHALHAAGIPVAILNARAAASDRTFPWFRAVHDMRRLGTRAAEPGFQSYRLAPAFDALLFVDQSTASKPIR